ncbi:MAG: NAD(P)H-hydrate dehydratase [Spirochaetaceae bacterium]|nr:MAG: NAD(P)H-hydrate dehydratase [Spirochaetaceae bacterium]
MKVVDSHGMGEIDREAQERFAIPEIVLMEHAGRGIYTVMREQIWRGALPDGPVLFLAGKGNNGGDALVVARHCHFAGMRRMSVILGAGQPNADSLAGVHLKILRTLGVELLDYREASRRAHRLLEESQWLVDGLFGTGLSGEVRPPVKELIRRCNQVSALRIAIDIPSGIGNAYRPGYTAFQAEYTLSVELPKLCLYLPHTRKFCGQIVPVPGVFPQELIDQEDIPGYLIGDSLKQRFLQPLDPDTHKGKRGHLAVFAGCEGTTGAAWLCSTAAARCRAGLVTLFIDRDLYGHNIQKYSSVMLRPWDGEMPELSRFDTLLVGPGWGVSEQREQVLARLLQSGLAGVLDADGISLLARMRERGRVQLGERWILTPHPGEFARLLGAEIPAVLADPLPQLLRLSAELEAVIVLKGHCSFVVSPQGRYGILDGMNPGMATGGSGDVLAGICAGLLTSGCAPEQAASLAVLLHSDIGRKLYRDRGYFLAEDMVAAVSSICK